MASKAKGIPADGEKIKALRQKLGVGQKGLVQGSTVELRTYQRAEQGGSILPEILQQIAILLKVDLEEIRNDTDRGETPRRASGFRLNNALKAGANKLMRCLREGCWQVNYEYEINPDAELASEVASLVRDLEIWHNEECRPKKPHPYTENNWREVEYIGQFNEQLNALHLSGVHLFFGYVRAHVPAPCETLFFPTEVTGGNGIRPFDVAGRVILIMVFSHESGDTLPYQDGYYTAPMARRLAMRRNIELGIHPDWFDGSHFVFDQKYVAEYRAMYAEERPSNVGWGK